MISIADASIRQVLIQSVPQDISSASYNPDIYEGLTEKESTVFKNIFLGPFTKTFSTHEFYHDVNLDLNPALSICKTILDTGKLEKPVKDLFQHLRTVSKHPNIKRGELVVVYFENVKFESSHYNALGIYKIEDKDQFIETADARKETSFHFREGVTARKINKAALVLYTKEPFTILSIDVARTAAEYWTDAFLGIRERNDNANNTAQFLNITKNYVTTQLAEEFEVSKADQIDMLNRSASYFKSKEAFNLEEFETEVLQDENVIRSFRSYDSQYRQENHLDIEDEFEISPQAAKKQLRTFKSVLKLDKNFHIYIHGDRQLIQKGVEEDGRKFYKIYFDSELD